MEGTGAAEGVVLLTLSSEKVNELVSLVYESHPQACKHECCQSGKNHQVKREQDRQWESRNYRDVKILWNTHEMIKLQARHGSHATSVFHYKLRSIRFALIWVIYWVSILIHEIHQQINCISETEWHMKEASIKQWITSVPQAAL